ncbi:MAG: hypothetical protein V4484_10670 [Pseudomonadota bacterium]
MKTISFVALATLLAWFCGQALAGPAPWYLMRSKLDGKQVCAQTPLGTGWERAAGPYADSHCTKLVAKQK